MRGPHDHADLRVRPVLALEVAQDAEVEDGGVAVGADEDVAGLDVAVDEALGVDVVEAGAQLRARCGAPRAAVAAALRLQRASRRGVALQLLHHDEGAALVPADGVDEHDVGVLEVGGEPGLALEAGDELLVARTARRRAS